MTEHKIFIIVAGKEDVSKLFGKVGASAKKVEKDTKGLGAAFGKLVPKALKSDLAKLAGGAAILGIGKASIQASLGAERFRNSLEGLAGGAKEATGFIEAIQGASLGTISQLDAMAISSKALSLKVVGNAKNMKDLTEVAITLGQAQGLSAKQSVDDLTTAIGRQSPLILDNLGITLKASEAQDIYAQSMGKTAKDLTDLEKSQAFANAALIKGKEAAAKLGGVQLDSAAKMERLNAQLADSAIILGDAVVPAFTVFVDIAAQALTALEPLLTGFAEMTAGLDEMNTAIDEADAAAESMGSQFSALVDEGMSTGEALDVMAAKMDKANDAIDNMSGLQKLAADALGKTGAAAHTVGMAQVSLNKEVASGARTYKEYIAQLNSFNKSATNSESKIEAMTISEFKRQKEFEKGTAALAAGATLTELYGGATDEASQAQVAFSEAVRQHALEQAALAPQYGSVTRESLGLSDATAQQIDLQERAAQATFDNAEAMENSEGFSVAFALQQEVAAGSAGRAASAAARQADVNARLAESQRQAAATTAAYAQEQANLMTSLSGATEEQFKQAVFAEIDPATIGVEAYASLGVELGVLDEKAANLAAAVPILTQAYTDGIIPTENMAAATTALFEAAGTADFNTGALLDEFAKAPGLIGPSADATEDFAEKLASMDEVVVSMTGNINALADAFTNTANAAGSLPAIPAGGTGGGVPAFADGGMVPGSPHQAVPIIAHGGERVVPEGQSVGPFGPPTMAGDGRPPASSGGTTIINVPSLLAAKMLADQRFQERKAKM